MNFMDAELWWPQGEFVLKEIINGILADDKILNDYIIREHKSLKLFKKNIAIYDYKKSRNDTGKIEYVYYPNIKDEILNNKIEIEFETEIIIVITSAEIKEVIFNKSLESYLIILKEDQRERNFYSIGICEKIEGDKNFRIHLLNKKPPYLKLDRNFNSNDDY